MYKYAQHLNLSLHPTSPDDYPGDDVLLFDVDCSSNSSDVTTTALSIVNRNLFAYWTVNMFHWLNNKVCNTLNYIMGTSGGKFTGIHSYLPIISDIHLHSSHTINNKTCNKCKYSLVTQERYKEVLKRYEWITDNIDIHVHPSHDCCLSEAFKNATVASEDPSLPYGPLTPADRRCLNWCFDRIAIDSGLPVHKVGLHVF